LIETSHVHFVPEPVIPKVRRREILHQGAAIGAYHSDLPTLIQINAAISIADGFLASNKRLPIRTTLYLRICLQHEEFDYDAPGPVRRLLDCGLFCTDD
jgi:hypothetical protein